MQGSGLPDLIALAYESACESSGLQEFAEAATDYFGADGAAVVIWPRQGPTGLMQFSHGLDDRDLQEWFSARDNSASLFGLLQTADNLATFQSAGAEPGWPAGATLASVVDADRANVCGLILVRNNDGRPEPSVHRSFCPASGSPHDPGRGAAGYSDS